MYTDDRDLFSHSILRRSIFCRSDLLCGLCDLKVTIADRIAKDEGPNSGEPVGRLIPNRPSLTYRWCVVWIQILDWIPGLQTDRSSGLSQLRICLLGHGTLSATEVAVSVAVTLVVLVTGIAAFQKVERTVIDSV